ncbi:MAG: MATE family efflux transporter [Oscillospiraceae bacterium]|jgi:putative MATE family efflux protein|nr:MATE family efflux transporter [Oscillospiraceae bacterium]
MSAENKMGIMPVNKLLITMSVPIMLSMIVQALYNIVDSIFVSMVSENALTAVSLAFPVQILMIAAAVGTGVGMNSFLSRSLGAKDYDAVNRTANAGFVLSWLGSLVFILIGIFGAEAFFSSQTDITEIVSYGRDYLSIVCIFSFGVFNQVLAERLLVSTGRTVYSMITQIVGAVVNLILDPIMIFGLLGFPRMEVAGAAIATVIGEIVAAAVGLYINHRVNKEIKISPASVKNAFLKPDWKIIGQIYAVGLPAIVMQSIGSLMVYVFNRILLDFTPTAATVFGAYFKLQSFIFMPVFGLNNGMVPIISYNYGARHKDRIVKTIKLSLVYAAGFMLLGIALFNFIPDKLLGLFNPSPEMLDIGVTALRIISVHYCFAGFSIVLVSVFQALGNGVYSLCVSVARQLLVLLPSAWLFSLSGELSSVWWSFPVAEFVSLACCLFFIRAIYRAKIKYLAPSANIHHMTEVNAG